MSAEIFTGDIVLSYEKTKIYRTLVSPFMSGKEQRRSKWTRPKHRFKWGATGRNTEQSDYLYNFFNGKSGKGESFYWEATDESPISQSGDEHVGTGTGSEKSFQFDRYPVKSGDCDLTVDGTPVTEASDYTVNYTTGAIEFSVAPGSAELVMATDYRFYYQVRFGGDELSREQFAYKLWNFDIDLVEVL